jgi:hypothetical protein
VRGADGVARFMVAVISGSERDDDCAAFDVGG